MDKKDPRDPDHPLWADSKFGMLDASFGFQVNRNRDVLIYPYDRDPEFRNIIIMGRHIGLILEAHERLTEQTDCTIP